MPIAESLLSEWDVEAFKTRKTLERVPEDRLGWKPHPKSGTLAWLAGHVGMLLGWAALTMTTGEFDYAPVGKPYTPPPAPASRQDLLERFDKANADARAAIAKATDEDLLTPWSLLAGGKAIFTKPRVEVVRSMIMNHSIHHRGQLTVYLRLLDVPVPALYGPSADES
jgi:uncharacterized damage-inducible protein DinB